MRFFQISRNTYASLAKARSDLIKSGALRDHPIWRRLWHHHLFWICTFAKSAASVGAKGILWAVCRRFYRLADRMAGTSREKEFCERLRKKAESYEGKVREIRSKEADRRWRNEQFAAALEREIKQELVALAQGKSVDRDPETFN